MKRLQELETRNWNQEKLLYADSQKSNLRRFNWLLNDGPAGLEPQWGDWVRALSRIRDRQRLRATHPHGLHEQKLLAARLVDFSPPLATVHLTAVGETWRPMFHLMARKLVSRPSKPAFCALGCG